MDNWALNDPEAFKDVWFKAVFEVAEVDDLSDYIDKLLDKPFLLIKLIALKDTHEGLVLRALPPIEIGFHFKHLVS